MKTFSIFRHGDKLVFADTPCGDPAFLWHVDVFPLYFIPDGEECRINIKPLRDDEYDPENTDHYFLLKGRDMFIRHVYQACPGPQYREHYCTTIHVDDLPDVENLQYIALEAE